MLIPALCIVGNIVVEDDMQTQPFHPLTCLPLLLPPPVVSTMTEETPMAKATLVKTGHTDGRSSAPASAEQNPLPSPRSSPTADVTCTGDHCKA
ncbi:hypothetical protein ACSBR2_004715 [Camellia fascicularis]